MKGNLPDKVALLHGFKLKAVLMANVPMRTLVARVALQTVVCSFQKCRQQLDESYRRN